MTSTQPVPKKPVVYVSCPFGVLSGISAQLVSAGAVPVVGWIAPGLFGAIPPELTKAIVGKCDAVFVPGIVAGDMNTEIAGATEAGVPVFNDWDAMQDFIRQFGGIQITVKARKTTKKESKS